MRYKDTEKIIPPVQEEDLRVRLEMKKLQLKNQLQNETTASPIEELKGSIKQIDDKFDRLIQQVEETTQLTQSIHLKVKDIIWGIEASKNEE